ncbi:hypothetical protein [Empedobacter brevis]|uniref:hypothetical protein n=1 Tax=Empedobacter brevis TaxID=247 RepID=UPI0028D25A67|nr:hypothetical protein [Empedobacter brevis]
MKGTHNLFWFVFVEGFVVTTYVKLLKVKGTHNWPEPTFKPCPVVTTYVKLLKVKGTHNTDNTQIHE